MRGWGCAVAFGVVGIGVGAYVADAVGRTSMQPLCMSASGICLAILGAILGGTMDIVNAIKESGRRPSAPQRHG